VLSGELEAIVIGTIDYGDADRIVHLLTERGRLAAFAHGARKSKRRFQGALEPFTTIKAQLDKKAGKEGMSTLASASIERARLALRDDLAKIAIASYVVELGGLVAPEGQPAEELYALVRRTLDRMVEHAATIAVLRAFELSLIDVLGYRPQLEACAICGNDAVPAFLDLSRGGVLCETHRNNAPEIGPRTLEWMRRVLSSTDRFDEDGGLGAEWAERAAKRLAGATRSFFIGLLGRAPKSTTLLDAIEI
jgi:DNA repair protein RecO (recombination protein O)